jgi:tRNA-specific 2-thiouridylase
MVTGHYARVTMGADVELHRGVDSAKDQSYVLSRLPLDIVRHCLFPLGDSVKTEVRAEATARGFAVADKPESFDICFIPDKDTAGYLHEKLGEAPGDITDTDGTVLGHHQGMFTYTIGQRKGLHLGRPAADGEPRFVVALDAATNTVVVGSRDRLAISTVRAKDARWLIEPPTASIAVGVQMRAHAAPVPARAMIAESGLVIDLNESAYGIAPGQTAVLYDGTRVIGSAIITSAHNAPV